MMPAPCPLLCYYRYSKGMTGGPRDVLDLLTRVDRDRFLPFFVTQRESPLTEAVRSLGVPVEVVPTPEILEADGGRGLRYGPRDRMACVRAVAAYSARIHEVIRRRGARAVWARSSRSVMLVGAAARASGAPLVWDIGMEPPRPSGLMRMILWYGLAAATRIVTQAACQPEQIFGPRVARRFAAKFHPITPGIDEQRAARLREATERGRGERRGGRVLCLASITPRKNQMMMLRALERVVRHHPALVVQFAGGVLDAAYRDRLLRFVRARGLEANVEFLGWRDDVPGLLSRADVLVLCSELEGTPQVVREAMFAGVPVVVTRIGGNEEAVDHGATGFLVPRDDDARLADHLVALLHDPELRGRIGRAAARTAQERFSIARWSETYNALLSSVAP
jgi:glycosyltransferase involved in cell wall biosynthesis